MVEVDMSSDFVCWFKFNIHKSYENKIKLWLYFYKKNIVKVDKNKKQSTCKSRQT